MGADSSGRSARDPLAQGNRMNAVEVLRLVRTALTGRTDWTNASSQDSASLHPGLFSARPSGTRGVFDWLASGNVSGL